MTEQPPQVTTAKPAEGPNLLPIVMTAPRRGKPPRHWIDLSVEERKAAVVEAGHPAFRAQQLSKHWFERLSQDPEDWTDLPKDARAGLAETFFPPLLQPIHTSTCDNDTTLKTLWRLHDGALVESVLMRYGVNTGSEGAARTTICVSSQAGCGMACPFCATGQGGLERNMSAAEIVQQAVVGAGRLARGELAGGPGRISNVVFMGMGEPLANYKAVVSAVRTMNAPAPHGLGISARGITVSTVGLVPRMRQLVQEKVPMTLALSLHAPDDELRDEIVPINTRWKVGEVLDAAWEYARESKRRVSIEYIMIKDINDQAWRADLLAKKLQQRGDWGWVHVNLIPLNPTPGSKWTASRPQDEREFVRRLESHGIPVTVRDTRGQEIDGACGQLAATQA